MTPARRKAAPAKTKPATLFALLRDSARRLKAAKLAYGHGTSDADEEAMWLALETLGLPVDEPPQDRALDAAAAAAVRKIVAARIETRKPAAYLLKKAYLQGLPFYVDERVIVPRSFIAELMMDDLGLLGNPKTVLDLCTGSGCLAVLAAHVYPKAKVDGVDLSSGAVAVAQRNVKAYRLGRRVNILKGNLFAPVAKKKYDLIIANPPYVDAKAMKKLPPEYSHEPAMALASGRDGLDLVRRILREAPQHLTPGGALLCEIGRGRKALEKAFPRLPFLWLDTVASEGEVFYLTREQFLNARTDPVKT